MWPTGPPFALCDTFTITADTYLNALYFDGVQVPSASLPHATSWSATDTVSVSASVGVIAVQATYDYWSPYAHSTATYGIIAANNNARIVTNGTWKCSSTPATNWQLPSFDDSSWTASAAFWDTAYSGTVVAGATSFIWYSGVPTIPPTPMSTYCRFNNSQ